MSEVVISENRAVASFKANKYSGKSPLTVTFTNLSQAPADTVFFWDFGDGQKSVEESPTHIYHSPGYYTVILSIIRREVIDCAPDSSELYHCIGQNDIILDSVSTTIQVSQKESLFDKIIKYWPIIVGFGMVTYLTGSGKEKKE